MREAVIVSTARTPIGKAYRGAFNNTQGQQLAVYVLTHAGSARRARGKRDRGRLPGCAMPQGSTGSRDSAADRVARGDTDLVGRHRPGTREQARGCQRTGGIRPGPGAHPIHWRRRRRSLRAACARRPCSGTRRSAPTISSWPCSTTPHSTGAQILTDLVTLSIGEMREHLRRELAHGPTPGPHRIPIRLSDDEYTRAHAAAQSLETSGPRPAEEPRQQIGEDAQRNPPTLPRPRPPDPKSPYSLGRGFKCYAAALTVIST